MPADERVAALARLASARVGHLATATPDGRPHLVPLCFVLMEDTVYSVVDDKPKRTRTGLRRLRNIEVNPQASLLVDHYDEDWSALWFVLVEGEAAIVSDPGEYRDALACLRAKYRQYLAMRMARTTHPMIRVRIRTVVAWQAATPAG